MQVFAQRNTTAAEQNNIKNGKRCEECCVCYFSKADSHVRKGPQSIESIWHRMSFIVYSSLRNLDEMANETKKVYGSYFSKLVVKEVTNNLG
ncbi:unnamed protein product, partial [Mesorhabditis spiculigera]